jgi:glycosyltransferase involved in cell wall biosynthesis
MLIDIVYGSALWHAPTKVNCHFVAERLAREVPVVFVESVGARMPRSHEWQRVGRRLLRSFRPVRRVDERLWVYSPLPLPAFGQRSLKTNSAWVGCQVRAMLAVRGWRPQVSWIFHPMGWGVARSRRTLGRVYYCVDDYSANPGVNGDAVRRLETELAALCDVTLATGDPLATRLRQHGRDVRIVPNVADTALFTADHSRASHPVLHGLDRLPHPRLGYIGNLASYKIDLELVGNLASSRPDWAIVLVGPRSMGDVRENLARAAFPSNVHVFDAVPHALTPAVIDRFDVCLLPAAEHPVMRSSFPLKFFEYLLRGRPVVGRPLPALEPYRHWYYPAASRDEFVRAVERALRSGCSRNAIREKIAKRFGWDERARLLVSLRKELLSV